MRQRSVRTEAAVPNDNIPETAIGAALKTPHPNSSVSACVTISPGVASTISDKSKRPDGLLHTVDQALYHAKQNGRKQIKVAEQ